jgi:hypothetical protein
MNSPEDWETMCIPANWHINFNAVDFPLEGSPMAVGTGQEPEKSIVFIQLQRGCKRSNNGLSIDPYRES